MKEGRTLYDSGKVILGVAVFLCLASFPAWYNVITSKADYRPDPVIVVSDNQCIESTQYMREYHMQLLKEWRDDAVRNGKAIYTASDNKTYEINLTGTCLKCHSNKSEFCDTCHDFSGVSPTCWDCHNIPESGK